jgi:hypothetical protein
MRWIVTRAVKVALGVSVGLGIAAFTVAGLRTVFLDAYLLAIGGVLLLALVRATRAQESSAKPSQLERALDAMRRMPAPDRKLALVRDLELSTVNAFHLHVRVRPLLCEIAAHRLLRRYGVDLEAEPIRARELVGIAAWELVRPDRPPPADRLAAGQPVSQVREVVAELEAI